MTNISFNPNRSLSTRFGQSGQTSQANRKLHAYFEQVDEGMERIKHISANETKPETSVSKHLKNIRQGAILALSFFGLLVAGSSGLVLRSNVQQQRPTEVMVARHEHLGPDWQHLKETAVLADIKFNDNPEQANAEFLGSVQKLLVQLIDTIAVAPPSEDARQAALALSKQVEASSTFKPERVAAKTAQEIMDYLRTEAENPLPDYPSDRDITMAFADFKTDFIETHDVLKTLSPAMQESLVEGLKARLKEPYMRTSLNFNFLVPVVKTYMGTGVEGVSFEDFRTLSTEEDALKLFNAIMENEANFPNLTGDARERFQEYGVEALQSLELESPNPMYGALAMGLMMLGALGSPALLLLKGKDMLGATVSAFSLNQALESPMLFVVNSDQADVDGIRRLERLNEGIDEKTGLMVEAMKRVVDSDATVKDFMLQLFGDESKFPNARWFRNRYTYDVVMERFEKMTRQERLAEKPIGGIAFLEPIALEVDAATMTGDVFKVVNTQPAKPVSANLQASTEDKLLQEKQRIESLMSDALALYSNKQFGRALASILQQSLSGKIAELETTFQTLGNAYQADQGNTGKEAAFMDAYQRLEDAKKDKAMADERMQNAQTLVEYSQKIMDDFVVPLRDYHRRIQEALDRHNFSVSVEQLRQIETQSGAVQEDPRLRKILEEDALQSFIQAEAANTRSIKAEVQSSLQSAVARAALSGKELLNKLESNA